MSTDTATRAAAPTLRTARHDDLAAIERLLAASDLPTAGVAAIVAARPDDFVVADDPDATGEIVAVGGLEVCCENALLRSVAVRPEWREQGLGHELVRRLVCRAEERGIRALYLLTMTAEHYFPRFGFERAERGAVPADIADTLEFRSACPASATVMVRSLAAR
jgi:amino-acid N-acetyltransferase